MLLLIYRPHPVYIYIFGNYKRALRGPKEIFERSEMVLVAIKRFFGDLIEPW